MKKLSSILIIIIFLLIDCALAATVELDSISLSAASNAPIPDGLTEREAEIYRQGFADGYNLAIHPENDTGHYIVNIKSGKFHFPSCNIVAAKRPEASRRSPRAGQRRIVNGLVNALLRTDMALTDDEWKSPKQG